ncbi:MAG: SpoVG family protein [Pirellulaceae bacterium]|jgi:stage V sporulation protein G|nr:SpoVG family protein [Pirellulaceae bacterium]
MQITEVRIKLMEDSDDRLQAFCSITIDDCFVVRDLKIIEGTSGPFVAMPSRKLTAHCPQCGTKNHLRSSYCNHCGTRLKEDRASRDPEGRAKLYADIAHPINSQCREMIQKCVIEEYRAERERAKQPDYVSRYDDSYEDEFESEELVAEYERAARDGELVKRRTSERIQPAAAEPRAPHLAPAPGPAPEPRRRSNDQFGAGVFD